MVVVAFPYTILVAFPKLVCLLPKANYLFLKVNFKVRNVEMCFSIDN